MLSGWSPENENFASLEKFEAAKGGFCNLFLQRNFIQISSTGKKKERNRFTGTETHKTLNIEFLKDRCAFQGKRAQPRLIC